MTDIEQALKSAISVAVSLFGVLWWISLDFSDPVSSTESVARFMYAFTMVYAPTSPVAIAIDVAAAIIASIGIFAGLDKNVKQTFVGVATLYFFISLTVNYAMAPV